MITYGKVADIGYESMVKSLIQIKLSKSPKFIVFDLKDCDDQFAKSIHDKRHNSNWLSYYGKGSWGENKLCLINLYSPVQRADIPRESNAKNDPSVLEMLCLLCLSMEYRDEPLNDKNMSLEQKLNLLKIANISSMKGRQETIKSVIELFPDLGQAKDKFESALSFYYGKICTIEKI